MEYAQTQKEREFIATVALLDIDPGRLGELVETHEPALIEHLRDCRSHVLSFLEMYDIHPGGRNGAITGSPENPPA
jgi:hypothetical protein